MARRASRITMACGSVWAKASCGTASGSPAPPASRMSGTPRYTKRRWPAPLNLPRSSKSLTRMMPACSGSSRATGKPPSTVERSASAPAKVPSGQRIAATVGCAARFDAPTEPSTGSPKGIAPDGRATTTAGSGAGSACATVCGDALAGIGSDALTGACSVVCDETTATSSVPVIVTCTVAVVPSAVATVNVSDTDCPTFRLSKALFAV